MAYADTSGLYQSTRGEPASSMPGSSTAFCCRQDCLAERMANDPVARRLLSEINELTLTTELPRNRVAMLLLEAAWAMSLLARHPGTASPTVSPELAAIRDALVAGRQHGRRLVTGHHRPGCSYCPPHEQNGGTKEGTMADNYTQFSFAIEKLTPEECTWNQKTSWR